MKIGIIDADLIGRKKHRFPNLACMKIAGYYKGIGCDVDLLLGYNNIVKYDKVFISKVFTDTHIDEYVLKLPNVEYGGTGFFYDKAEPLPYEIEHHMPYYDLYKEWVEKRLEEGIKRNELTYYLDYSIGFTTRGCFRQCAFCINQNYTKVSRHSNIEEFLDKDRKYICLLDDNVLGCGKWKEIFEELNSTGKRFQFKQGMDERTLTEDKIKTILSSNYIGDIIFAFDNIKDKNIIENKLKLWRTIDNKKNMKFYVLCGFDETGNYSDDFWIKDIEDTFERIKILMKYKCLPYIMRYKEYDRSPYRGMYISLARWCNQPSFFKKKSFREFAIANGYKSSTMRYLIEFEKNNPCISKYYFDMKYDCDVKKEKVKLGSVECEQYKWII